MCKVLKGGAVFSAVTIPGENGTVKVLSRGGCNAETGTSRGRSERRLHVERRMDCRLWECRRGIVKRLRASRTSSTWGSPWFRLKKGQPRGCVRSDDRRGTSSGGETSVQSERALVLMLHTILELLFATHFDSLKHAKRAL